MRQCGRALSKDMPWTLLCQGRGSRTHSKSYPNLAQQEHFPVEVFRRDYFKVIRGITVSKTRELKTSFHLVAESNNHRDKKKSAHLCWASCPEFGKRDKLGILFQRGMNRSGFAFSLWMRGEGRRLCLFHGFWPDTGGLSRKRGQINSKTQESGLFSFQLQRVNEGMEELRSSEKRNGMNEYALTNE